MKRIHTTPTASHMPAAKHPGAHVNVTAEGTIEAAAAPATPATSTTPAIPVLPAPGTPAADTGPGIVFIGLPPAISSIPVVPKGWVPGPSSDYRGTLPRTAELTTLEGAISDLQRFTTFLQTFGNTVPPLDHILQLFQAGLQWSAMRVATAEWDVFAGAQEGLSWGAIRAVMDLLRPSFDLAVQVNSTLTTQFPSLTSLLGAQKVIARRGAATRAANKSDVAEGKPKSHGKVGKAAQKAAAKAALAAATAAPAPAQPAPAPVTPGPTTTMPTTPSSPVTGH